MIELIRAPFDHVPGVRTASTTRAGGVSDGPYRSLNLGLGAGDAPRAVARNRARLAAALGLAAPWPWPSQVHGTRVVHAAALAGAGVEADAVVSDRPGLVCCVLTADCLPVLLTDRAGRVVGAAHAGWRGLAAGVLEATVAAMGVVPQSLLAWLGPAIGPARYEVGDDVRDAFLAAGADAAQAFSPTRAGHWLADLYRLARLRLARAGVSDVSGGGHCTHAESSRFFSYRRDGVTGRMASMIWITSATRARPAS